jgi:sporulation protein YlmC with PRC-barrel domain
MATGETFNEQARLNGPAILELLSELEKRDKENKGKVQSGSIAGAGMGDPRGFAVVNVTGNAVGKVEDLYVDPHTREPHFAVLSLGGHTLGIGNRHVLVGYGDLTVLDKKQVQVSRALG